MGDEVSFGQWLAKRRKALDLTRSELAQKVGYSVSALRKVETDERRPSKQLAESLADVLDIPKDERLTFIKIARGERSIEGSHSPHHLPSIDLLHSSQGLSNFIPAPLTPLIGRKTELSALLQMLGDPECRLISLVGPGGIGKTRLAMEVAIEQNKRNKDKAVLVSLAPINSAFLIVPAIADAMGFRMQSSGDPGKQLLNYLNGKNSLLVLDNFEHVMEGVGLLVDIIKYASGVKILCTSRERMNVQGEWVFEVGGLGDPDAVKLFSSCARRIETDFQTTDDNRAEIEKICHLVEGMPLAIELAATWKRLLSLAEIVREIQKNLDFLSTGMRDLPERHRSMRAVFEHSWSLLPIGEQLVLSRLSVFRGGFTHEAAEHVAGASLAVLLSLISRSLVQRTETRRFHVHELLRQFTASLLQTDGEEQIMAQERHYDFYLQRAEAAKHGSDGTRQSESLEWLEQEHDNLRAALDWSLDKHDNRALQLACSLRWFWYVHGHFHEGRDWLVKALQSVPVSHSRDIRLRARALEGIALLVNAFGDHSTARQKAEESVTLFREIGDQRGLADALLLIGHAMLWQGEMAGGQARLQEALALYREADDRLGIARTLSRLGSYLADWAGNLTGRKMLEESVAILQELGDQYFIANTLISLGIVSLGSGEFSYARAQFEKALAVSHETGHVWSIADALTNLGCVARIVGDYDIGRSYLEEALKIYKEQGFSIWRADPLCALAEINIAQDELSLARLRLQEAFALVEKSDNKWLQTLVSYFLGLLAYYEGDIHRAAKLLEESTTMARNSQYMPDLARSLTALGSVMGMQGNVNRAVTLTCEGLNLYLRMDQKLGIAMSLERLAGLVSEKNARNATKLFGLAEVIRESIGAPLPPVDRQPYENEVARAHAQLDERTFARAWAEGRAIPLEKMTEFVSSNDCLDFLEIQI